MEAKDMTTQTAVQTDTNSPSSLKSSTEGRAGMELSDIAPVVKAKLRDMVDSGKDRVVVWRDGIQDGIRERPIQSILIAAAAGAVIGLILGRRGR
jgi:ElaB/YqjD/DUF883 family membrane-anchored ribosome-binding protein